MLHVIIVLSRIIFKISLKGHLQNSSIFSEKISRRACKDQFKQDSAFWTYIQKRHPVKSINDFFMTFEDENQIS